MTGRANLCASCDNISQETRKLDPSKWTCVKAPREGLQGVVDEDWLFSNPYELCWKVRVIFRLHCPLYRERLPGQKSLALKENQ